MSSVLRILVDSILVSMLVFGRVPQVAGGFHRDGIEASSVVPRPSTASDVASGFRLADVEHQIQ